MSLCLLVLISGYKKGPSNADLKTVTVGSKNCSESVLLAHMFADLIEAHTDLKVVRKLNLGSSNLAWAAINNNDIQLYPEYSGTIIMSYYQQEVGSEEDSFEKAHQLVQTNGLSFTDNLGFNSRYVIVVDPTIAAEKQLATLSDLSTCSEAFKFACDFEFIDRPDGYPTLSQAYPMHFSSIKCMDHGFLYRALQNNYSDAVATYSTDAQLEIYKFRVLEDDKGFAPSYISGILIRNDLLAQYPEVALALSKLRGQITEKEMRQLNMKLEHEGLKGQWVAREFLESKGLLTESNTNNPRQVKENYNSSRS